jgi:acyl-CoA hydrolase
MRELAATALDLATWVRPGDTVMWGQANAEPLALTRALVAQRHDLGPVRAFVGVSWFDTVDPAHADRIAFASYCGAGRNRTVARAGRLEIFGSHYSALARDLRSGALRVDVLMLQLAPADAAGRYSLGISHEYLVPALEHARVVLAEVNDRVPWTHGGTTLGDDDLDAIVRTSRPLDEPPTTREAEVDAAVARRVAALVDDGATLQVGLGVLPALVLRELASRRDLGIHSGQIGDAVVDLADSGALTNAQKSVDRGVTIAGNMLGGARLHRYVDRNPAVQFRSTEYTHDAAVLASHERLVAINSAVEVDLTGQVNAEVANGVYVGAVGGLADFLRGAARSRGGLPIIALPARAGAASRIVATLGGPVTVARSDVALVVTEHGVADLRGVPLAARAERMIAIADPDARAGLAETLRSGAAHESPARGTR